MQLRNPQRRHLPLSYGGTGETKPSSAISALKTVCGTGSVSIGMTCIKDTCDMADRMAQTGIRGNNTHSRNPRPNWVYP